MRCQLDKFTPSLYYPPFILFQLKHFFHTPKSLITMGDPQYQSFSTPPSRRQYIIPAILHTDFFTLVISRLIPSHQRSWPPQWLWLSNWWLGSFFLLVTHRLIHKITTPFFVSCYCRSLILGTLNLIFKS